MDWESFIPPRGGQEGPFRLGAVPFLYAEPLVQGLRDRADVPLDRAHPGALASDLCAGRLAGALLPVLEAARGPRLRIVPGIGVCASRTSAQRLLCRVPASEVKTLAVLGGDESMGAVARILLAEVHGARPRVVESSTHPDAVVLTGDAGLKPHAPFPHANDVADLWSSHTGLPLVVAVWTAGSGAPVARVRALVAQSAKAGLDSMPRVVGAVSEAHGVGESSTAAYLDGFSYRLGGEEVESIRRLVGLAAHYGFCAPDAAVTLC